jgi:hypothetical protein
VIDNTTGTSTATSYRPVFPFEAPGTASYSPGQGTVCLYCQRAAKWLFQLQISSYLEKTDFETVQILCTSSRKANSTVFQDHKALAMVWQHISPLWHIVFANRNRRIQSMGSASPRFSRCPWFPNPDTRAGLQRSYEILHWW